MTVAEPKTLFREHMDAVVAATEKALATFGSKGAGADGIVFHSGTRRYYHADDRDISFRTTPHFKRFAPVPGPENGQALVKVLYIAIDPAICRDSPRRPVIASAPCITNRIPMIRNSAWAAPSPSSLTRAMTFCCWT